MTTGDSALLKLRADIDEALDRVLSRSGTLSPRLVEAMRYAVLAGGKRIRPLLVLATADSLGAAPTAALPPPAPSS
jgi:geranylgeranyl pyrophosphate synthase